MLVINTTYHVSKLVDEDWTRWVRSEYIPEVTRSGIFLHPRFMRIFLENEDNSISYALQFEVDKFENLELWFETHGKKLKTEMSDIFHESVLGFTTVMELIEPL